LGEIPDDQTIVTYCETGYRSTVVAGVLQHFGRRSVAMLMGGIQAWREDGLPVE
jgi:hydroxyacylglutathione hydrolase